MSMIFLIKPYMFMQYAVFCNLHVTYLVNIDINQYQGLETSNTNIYTVRIKSGQLEGRQ